MRPAAPVRFQRLVLAVLAVSIIALGMADWRVLVSPPDSGTLQIAAKPTAPASLSAQPRPESPALALAQPKDYAVIQERPLFSPSRRPAPAVAVKPAPPPPKLVQPPFPADKMKLVGIMRSPGRPPQALVRTTLTEPGLWIAEGGMAGDWRIERVGEDKVDFSANGATGMLKLITIQAVADVPNTAAPAQAAAPASAPAPAAASVATPLPAPATVPAKK